MMVELIQIKIEAIQGFPIYKVHINMSTFSIRALILGHHKTSTQLAQPIFNNVRF